MGQTMTPFAQLSAAPPTDWQQRGLCTSVDGDVFFPPTHFEQKHEREAREAKAKAICARCPVRTPCLDWALATQEPHGVWGGYSESERKEILDGKREACSAC